jgi:hypothetical protein
MFGSLICAGALAGGLLLGRILPPNADTILTDAVSNQTLDSALDCIKNAARRQDFMRKGDALQVTCIGDPARALFDSVVGSNEISEASRPPYSAKTVQVVGTVSQRPLQLQPCDRP